jgi:hypothetical protein
VKPHRSNIASACKNGPLEKSLPPDLDLCPPPSAEEPYSFSWQSLPSSLQAAVFGAFRHPTIDCTKVSETMLTGATHILWSAQTLLRSEGLQGGFFLTGLRLFSRSYPETHWPYGSLVAVQEVGIRLGNDNELIRETLDRVLKRLKTLSIEVPLWPSA